MIEDWSNWCYGRGVSDSCEAICSIIVVLEADPTSQLFFNNITRLIECADTRYTIRVLDMDKSTHAVEVICRYCSGRIDVRRCPRHFIQGPLMGNSQTSRIVDFPQPVAE
jgi:hypothetical protein